MNRIAANLAGPELVWVLLYAATAWLAARNTPPTLAGNQRLELIGWFLPVIGALLSFAPLLWAPGNRWLWLLRIFVVGLVGIVAVTTRLCGAIDYQDSRNSGVGSAFVLYVILGAMALTAGVAALTVLFLTKWRAPA